MPDQFKGQASPLDATGLAAATDALQIDAPSIWTVLSVETSGVGFLADKRPKILFERHIFSKRTGHRFDQAHPDISNPTPGGYGAMGANQYLRLNQALALDPTAAIESASWGLGQIMGFNYAAAGFDNANDMVAAMLESESNQLLAMARFLKANSLDSALQQQDWAGFARGYNGPGYAKNEYDQKLAAFYAKLSAGSLPDLEVRAAQLLLLYLGFDPGPIDGALGQNTRAALSSYLASVKQPQQDAIDSGVLALLAQSASRI